MQMPCTWILYKVLYAPQRIVTERGLELGTLSSVDLHATARPIDHIVCRQSHFNSQGQNVLSVELYIVYCKKQKFRFVQNATQYPLTRDIYQQKIEAAACYHGEATFR